MSAEQPNDCSECNGKGFIFDKQSNMMGASGHMTCPKCSVPQHQTPNTGEDKCRAEFEKWYEDGNGCYGLKEDLWFVWQAAIEHVKSQAVITDERPTPADTSLEKELEALAAEFEYADPCRGAVDEAIAIVRQHQKSPYADYTWEDVAMLVQENRILKQHQPAQPVSLERCADAAAFRMDNNKQFTGQLPSAREITKAVLDAAGMKYE